MGCFDRVHVKCQSCGDEMEFQTKAGRCMMDDYTLSDAPPIVLGDMHGEVLTCGSCHAAWRVRVITIAQLERA